MCGRIQCEFREFSIMLLSGIGESGCCEVKGGVHAMRNRPGMKVVEQK
jgi:hypothetical protein